MDRKKLNKLQRECDDCRNGQRKARDFESLAAKLGRVLVNRGKEPYWESTVFSHLPALAIPHHGGKDIPTGTKNCIIAALQRDIDAWDERLREKEDEDE
jgi:hypothetical protein